MVLDDGFQIVGFVGGCFFPFATGVQTVKVFRTRSAKDISYGWQVIYGLGHILTLTYGIHFGLWVLWVPQVVELAIMLILVGAKIYFDHVCKRRDGVKRRTSSEISLQGTCEAPRQADRSAASS